MATQNAAEQNVAGTHFDLPLCPNCAKSMTLIQIRPALGALPVRSTFECKRCNILFTEVVTGESFIPERVSALHNEIYDALN